MTNFEKIKAMSVEKLAEALDDWCHCAGCPASEICNSFFPTEKFPRRVVCADYLKKWLESEVEQK